MNRMAINWFQRLLIVNYSGYIKRETTKSSSLNPLFDEMTMLMENELLPVVL